MKNSNIIRYLIPSYPVWSVLCGVPNPSDIQQQIEHYLNDP